MEKLLNKLIEKGWKPRGNQPEESLKKKLKVERYNRKPVAIVIKRPRRFIDEYYSFRELFSKESGLWQFVCENHLYIYKMGENKNFIQDHFKNEYNECCYQYLWDKSCYEYYLLESSLKDESELEDFLLSNINVEG